ncbi:MAG: patatin-like phospholipase family protein [Acidobacteriota bacterium]|nr:MAG: patatin-like phospholipase family protein [Acidobacteriota bacterium]
MKEAESQGDKSSGRAQGLLVCLLIPLLLFSFISAAPPEPKEHPSIGLVLGGGGARGLSHVGVIRWLEENRIPVDYVVGTSIGGLIGGLYAMGYSADEMSALLDELDWNTLLASSPRYNDLNFRRKQDSRFYPIDFELGLKNWQLSSPAGLNSGHFIGLLFDRLTLPYSGLASFDELPTPFRCVATDMGNAQEVVLADGSLSSALRSTMAIPGVFTPVERSGLILADGGMLNNVPVDVARQLGVSLTIAVDVGAPLKNASELQSLPGILDQSINVMMLDKVRRNLALADLVLGPDVAKWGTLEFDDFREIQQKGYEAAAAKAQFLKTLSVSESDWAEHLQRRSSRRKTGSRTPSEIRVAGTDSKSAERVQKSLSHHRNSELDPAELESELNAFYGSGFLYGLGYRVTPTSQGDLLTVQVREKKYGPPFVRFGIDIDGSELDDIDFGLRGRMTVLSPAGLGSELRVDLGIGQPWLLGGELYQPLGKGFFVAPHGKMERSITYLAENGDRLAEYRLTSTTAGFDLGYGFGRTRSEARIGYEIGHETARVRTGDPLLPSVEGTVSKLQASWIYDNLESAVIPRSGLLVNAGAAHFFQSAGYSGSFSQLFARVSGFIPVQGRGIAVLSAAAGNTIDKDSAPQHSFVLGGPLRLSAFSKDEFRGSRMLFGSAGYLHQVGDSSPIFTNRFYLATWYEIGNAYNLDMSCRLRQSISGGFVIDSVIGPVLIGGSWGSNETGQLFFTIGRLHWTEK